MVVVCKCKRKVPAWIVAVSSCAVIAVAIAVIIVGALFQTSRFY